MIPLAENEGEEDRRDFVDGSSKREKQAYKSPIRQTRNTHLSRKETGLKYSLALGNCFNHFLFAI